MIRVNVSILICWIALSASTFAQLNGRFYLDKETFISGEPVYLHFELTNTGKTTLQVQAADPYSFCAGYQIKISDGSPSLVRPSEGCSSPGMGGSCASGAGSLGSGQTKTESILLNYQHDFSKPGTYEITATRELPYATADQDVRPNGPMFYTTARLKFEIDRGDEATLEAILKPYVADLTAKDDHRNTEAHIVIGSVAPLFLEDNVLAMLNSETTRGFAVTTLGKINTTRSRRALAGVASGDSEWKGSAIQELGAMGDPTYYPLVLRAAQNSKPGSGMRQTAIRAAAELGHDQVIPFLLTLLQSSEKWDRINAVQGMYESGSRLAVAPLIDLLRDYDDFIARMAAGVLVTLTHRTPVSSGPYEKNAPAQYEVWRRWWSKYGETAPIYGPKDCGEIEQLASRDDRAGSGHTSGKTPN